MTLPIILICVIVILIFVNLRLYTQAVVARRQCETTEKAVAAERKATASLIHLASEEVGATDTEIPFLERYCSYTRRTMRVRGMAAFLREGDSFLGAAVSGVFPPLADLPDAVRDQLLSHPKYHKEHIRKISLPASDPILRKAINQREALIYQGVHPSWIPASSMGGVESLIIAPLISRSKTVGLAIVVQDADGAPLDELSANYVLRLSEIAGICIDGMRVSRERIEQEHRLRRAQEEGMLQITTGMVHNIGNAITVAQLITSDLLSNKQDREGSVLDFLLADMLPSLQQRQEDGSIGDFLLHDPAGRNYIDSMHDLLQHLRETRDGDLERLQALDTKLVHITEIIDLQQRFVGELGTEEVLPMEQPLKNAATIIRESAEKRDVELVNDLGETPFVLADRSMLTQVFLNLLTNALQSFDEVDREQRRITFRSYTDQRDGTRYSIVEISDNGCGIPQDGLATVFDLGYTTKRTDGGGRGMGLHFCRETITKYGGLLEVDSTPGEGSTFRVCLEP